MSVSDDVEQLSADAESLVSEGLEAPPVYRELSTEYVDLERLLEFLLGRSFSGLVRVALQGGEAHLLLFRGRPQAAKYGSDGTTEVGATAMERALAESRAADGAIWVHELPDELFPESWWEREAILVDLAPPTPDVESAYLKAMVEPVVEQPSLVTETELTAETEFAAETEPFREEPGPLPPDPVEEAPAADLDVGLVVEEPAASAEPEEEAAAADPELPGTETVLAQPVGDARVWAGLIEHMHARFRKFRGPAFAARMEAEVNAVLGDAGVHLKNGKVAGRPSRSHAALQAAALGGAAYIRQVAGRAFLEKSLNGALRDMRLDDTRPYRDVLGL